MNDNDEENKLLTFVYKNNSIEINYIKNYEEMKKLIKEKFNFTDYDMYSFSLIYKDEVNDNISVQNQSDYDQALNIFESENLEYKFEISFERLNQSQAFSNQEKNIDFRDSNFDINNEVNNNENYNNNEQMRSGMIFNREILTLNTNTNNDEDDNKKTDNFSNNNDNNFNEKTETENFNTKNEFSTENNKNSFENENELKSKIELELKSKFEKEFEEKLQIEKEKFESEKKNKLN